MPGLGGGPGSPCGVPNVPRSMPVVRSFRDNSAYEYPWALRGTTKDSGGSALGSCTLRLFRTADDSLAAQGLSDGSGNYVLGASPSVLHYLVAYLTGSPDVAGTTVNTLVGA